MKDTCTVLEIRKELGIDSRLIRIDIKSGRLPAVKVGKQYQIQVSDYRNYLIEYREKIKDAQGKKKKMVRKYTCRNYDDCLTPAAIGNKMLDCHGCQDYRPAEKEILIENEQLLPMLDLWSKVFGSPVRLRLKTE